MRSTARQKDPAMDATERTYRYCAGSRIVGLGFGSATTNAVPVAANAVTRAPERPRVWLEDHPL